MDVRCSGRSRPEYRTLARGARRAGQRRSYDRAAGLKAVRCALCRGSRNEVIAGILATAPCDAHPPSSADLAATVGLLADEIVIDAHLTARNKSIRAKRQAIAYVRRTPSVPKRAECLRRI